MMLVERDGKGQLTAAIDFYMVDDAGKLVFDGTGRHVWVEQLEISKGIDSLPILRRLIRQIALACTTALDAYWIRKDSTGMQLHQFARHRLLSKEVRV